MGLAPRQTFPDIGGPLFGDERAGAPPLEIDGARHSLSTTSTTHGICISHQLSGHEIGRSSKQMRDLVNVQPATDWPKEKPEHDARQSYARIQINCCQHTRTADQFEASAPPNRLGLR